MSRVFFIADLHLGHRGIVNFAGRERGGVTTIEEHDDWVIAQCNSVLQRRDVLWILGDIAWHIEALSRLDEIRCQKKLILGNHDKLDMPAYMTYGRVYPGLVRYKMHWLSHAPIHPDELRGVCNVHGHVHSQPIRYPQMTGEPDPMYFNVSVEAYNVPMTLEQLHERRKT